MPTNLPVLCYPSNSWKCNYYASEEAVLCSHYAQLCNGIYLWPKGWAKPLVVNWQIMAACSYKSFNKWKFATMCHAVFEHLKGANEVNRQYFQQAALLCLLKALYYAGICSYAACIILCPKLCWHNSPRPNNGRDNDYMVLREGSLWMYMCVHEITCVCLQLPIGLAWCTGYMLCSSTVPWP